MAPVEDGSGPWPDILACVKRVVGRIVAAAMVGAVLASQLAGNAAAEPELSLFRAEDCRSYQPTADGQVTQAWHLERLNMPEAWQIATGKGVTVAVIDTGMSPLGTPFLDASRVRTYDYLGGMSEKDGEAGGVDCDHGTKVASLIAAGRSGGQPYDVRTDFSGIAPDAEIISYRVLSTSGGGDSGGENDTLDATIAAVRNAIEEDVDIINLSQSAGGADPLIPQYRAAVEAAIEAGIIVVAAAGNADQGISGAPYPASFDGVISVGMVDRTDAPHAMSYPWQSVSIGAPGADLMALLPSMPRQNAPYSNQAYESGILGTSFAAPIVSGVVALLLEVYPGLSPEDVKQRLQVTADPPPNTIPDSRIGYGIVNPMRALTGVARPQVPNPGSDGTTNTNVTLPDPPRPNMVPAYIGVGVGVGALLVTGLGMVVAFTVPAAVRRNRASR
ncbi:S8 family serine peptidase [Tessaracoccus rhinocerotis]|uniref:S8 family serine peptidase n=1 Tax=Tessaracoccus rhinocerotis TaxID=1689449 RepID=A0A553JZ79_9ACTN|nr:S8 family serine peptidase [Tessaracoccus rhinocerotis]